MIIKIYYDKNKLYKWIIQSENEEHESRQYETSKIFLFHLTREINQLIDEHFKSIKTIRIEKYGEWNEEEFNQVKELIQVSFPEEFILL